MLRNAVESCSESLWLQGEPNAFWHIAYHVAFYTHLYLSPSEEDFRPWLLHRLGYQFLGAIPEEPGAPRIADRPDCVPYTKAEILSYIDTLFPEVERQLGVLDPNGASGFYWIPFSKLELQLYNIRHIAHHTGQLADRLRREANTGLAWVK